MWLTGWDRMFKKDLKLSYWLPKKDETVKTTLNSSIMTISKFKFSLPSLMCKCSLEMAFLVI